MIIIAFPTQVHNLTNERFELFFLPANVASIVLYIKGYKHVRHHPYLVALYQLSLGLAFLTLALGLLLLAATSSTDSMWRN